MDFRNQYAMDNVLFQEGTIPPSLIYFSFFRVDSITITNLQIRIRISGPSGLPTPGRVEHVNTLFWNVDPTIDNDPAKVDSQSSPQPFGRSPHYTSRKYTKYLSPAYSPEE
jgi:hypothetical protein